MEQAKYDIFISYSRKDIELVKKIKDEIESSVQVLCWMDLRNIPVGKDYLDYIVDGIENCKVFVFMLSESSQNSEHAIGELVAAYKQEQRTDIHVVLLNINDCEMNTAFTVRFATKNVIAWSDAPQKRYLMECLRRWVKSDNATCQSSSRKNKRLTNDDDIAPLNIERRFVESCKSTFLDSIRQFIEKIQYYMGKYVYVICGIYIVLLTTLCITRIINNVYHDYLFIISFCIFLIHGIVVFYPTNNTLNIKGIKYYNRGDYDSALRYFCKTAEKGDAYAQTQLGIMCENGHGVQQSYTEAFVWYRKAAMQGYAIAQDLLGCMYAKGTGVPQNDIEAVTWFRKAAIQGNAIAQFHLGLMYDNGCGVTQSKIEAVKWYRKAAEQGDSNAKKRLIELSNN